MDKEREPVEIKSYPIGRKEGRIFLVIRQEGKKPVFLIPEGVEVRQKLPSGELGPVLGINFQKADWGKFLVKDLKRRKQKTIALNPDKSSLKNIA